MCRGAQAKREKQRRRGARLHEGRAISGSDTRLRWRRRDGRTWLCSREFNGWPFDQSRQRRDGRALAFAHCALSAVMAEAAGQGMNPPKTTGKGKPPSSLDLALIGNGTIAALIDATGEIKWGCFPRFDGDPAFCSLLSGPKDRDDEIGLFSIDLVDCVRTEQEYLTNTPI